MLSGEVTLAGAVSRGVSLTNIAGNRELDFRFSCCEKKLSTGILRLRRKPLPLSAGKIRMMSLIIGSEVCQGLILGWEYPVSGCKVIALRRTDVSLEGGEENMFRFEGYSL